MHQHHKRPRDHVFGDVVKISTAVSFMTLGAFVSMTSHAFGAVELRHAAMLLLDVQPN